MSVQCKGSVKKLALGQCQEPGLTALGAERGAGEAGKGKTGRAVTLKPFIASRIKFN